MNILQVALIVFVLGTFGQGHAFAQNASSSSDVPQINAPNNNGIVTNNQTGGNNTINNLGPPPPTYARSGDLVIIPNTDGTYYIQQKFTLNSAYPLGQLIVATPQSGLVNSKNASPNQNEGAFEFIPQRIGSFSENSGSGTLGSERYFIQEIENAGAGSYSIAVKVKDPHFIPSFLIGVDLNHLAPLQ